MSGKENDVFCSRKVLCACKSLCFMNLMHGRIFGIIVQKKEKQSLTGCREFGSSNWVSDHWRLQWSRQLARALQTRVIRQVLEERLSSPQPSHGDNLSIYRGSRFKTKNYWRQFEVRYIDIQDLRKWLIFDNFFSPNFLISLRLRQFFLSVKNFSRVSGIFCVLQIFFSEFLELFELKELFS